MAGNEKEYLRDRIKLLYYAVLLFTLWLILLAVFQNPLNFYIFVGVLIIGAFAYIKRKSIKKWVKKQLSAKYPRVLLSYIPTVVWGGFAVFGIFIFGVFMGLSMQEEPRENNFSEDTKATQYKDVINSYQSISKLFYLQGQDMDIITNINTWESNPGELSDAIASYRQKRNEILFELGRLYEVRNRANLPKDPYLKTE